MSLIALPHSQSSDKFVRSSKWIDICDIVIAQLKRCDTRKMFKWGDIIYIITVKPEFFYRYKMYQRGKIADIVTPQIKRDQLREICQRSYIVISQFEFDQRNTIFQTGYIGNLFLIKINFLYFLNMKQAFDYRYSHGSQR
jgi:hypothetical protein